MLTELIGREAQNWLHFPGMQELNINTKVIKKLRLGLPHVEGEPSGRCSISWIPRGVKNSELS